MEDKASKAVLRYLEMTGRFEIYDADYEGFIVAVDTSRDEVVFIKFDLDKDDGPIKHLHVSASDFEVAASKFLAEHLDFVDMLVRYDEIVVKVVEEHRGLVRHQIDASDRLER